jgi:alanine dehydrogenase
VRTLMSNPYHVGEAVREADLVIGAVLIPGARAPKTVTEDMVRSMRPGAVIVDVAVDQGGSVETVDHSTTHRDPVYVRHGVVHYAVANMPGAVPRTSTLALTNVTLPYLLALARDGVQKALASDPALRHGLNVHEGVVTHRAVAEAHDLPYRPPEAALGLE